MAGAPPQLETKINKKRLEEHACLTSIIIVIELVEHGLHYSWILHLRHQSVQPGVRLLPPVDHSYQRQIVNKNDYTRQSRTCSIRPSTTPDKACERFETLSEVRYTGNRQQVSNSYRLCRAHRGIMLQVAVDRDGHRRQTEQPEPSLPNVRCSRTLFPNCPANTKVRYECSNTRRTQNDGRLHTKRNLDLPCKERSHRLTCPKQHHVEADDDVHKFPLSHSSVPNPPKSGVEHSRREM